MLSVSDPRLIALALLKVKALSTTAGNSCTVQVHRRRTLDSEQSYMNEWWMGWLLQLSVRSKLLTTCTSVSCGRSLHWEHSAHHRSLWASTGIVTYIDRHANSRLSSLDRSYSLSDEHWYDRSYGYNNGGGPHQQTVDLDVVQKHRNIAPCQHLSVDKRFICYCREATVSASYCYARLKLISVE